EVLPDEDAQLIAQLIKIIALINHGAADAQHIDTGIPCERERTAQAFPTAIQSVDVRDCPAGATAENNFVINLQCQLGRVTQQTLPPEAPLTQRPDVLFFVHRQFKRSEEH